MKRLRYILLLSVFYSFVRSQTDTVKITVTTISDKCEKGAATIQVSGGKLPYTINWSSGQVDVLTVDKLAAGDYYVTVKDSTKKETRLDFTIEKEKCPIIVENHFTPNGDNYNDDWNIYNTQYYPEFELFVFNKWGQQVHHQKHNFIPWDGDWGGTKAADGTYYYVFYYKSSDRNSFLKGDVTILR